MKIRGERYLIGLRRFLFRAPSPWLTVSTTVAVTLVLVYLISGTGGVVFIGMAYAIVNAVDFLWVHISREYFPLRRIILLNSVNAVLTCGYAMAFRLLSLPVYLPLAISHWSFLRTLTYATFLPRRGWLLAFLPVPLLLPVLYVLNVGMLWAYALMGTSMLALGLATLRIGERTVLKGLGVSPREFIRDFVNHLSRQDDETAEKLDSFFANMYREEEREIYALWSDDFVVIFPYVHPGPFGRIGSSDIVRRAEEVLGKRALVFHTATCHDDNTTTEGLKTLLRSLLNAEGAEISRISRPVRLRAGGVEVLYQRWGPAHLYALIPHRGSFDDVRHSVYRRLRNRVENAVLIDAHNSFGTHAEVLDDVDLPPPPGVETADDWRVGCGETAVDHPSMGDGGVRALAVEVNGFRFAYVLLDGNNVLEEVRRRIKDAVSDLVDDAEVFSTDNHTVNVSMVDVNPVGAGGGEDAIVAAAREAVKEALENLRRREMRFVKSSARVPLGGDGFLEKLEIHTKRGIYRTLGAMALSITTYLVACALITLWLA
jgi:putative membrane protein